MILVQSLQQFLAGSQESRSQHLGSMGKMLSMPAFIRVAADHVDPLCHLVLRGVERCQGGQTVGGYCRRFPPVAREAGAFFPVMKDFGWCGEWKAAFSDHERGER